MEERAIRARRREAGRPARQQRVRRPPQAFLPTAHGDVLGAAKMLKTLQPPAPRVERQKAQRAAATTVTATQARADAVAEFLRVNKGRHTRRDIVDRLWPGTAFLSGDQWSYIERDPRVSCTVEQGETSVREVRWYRFVLSGRMKRRQPESAPLRPARAGSTKVPAGRGAVGAWMDNKDAVRRLRAFASGKQTFEGFKLQPGGPSLGAPHAGSVFFHRLGIGRNTVHDEYEWRHPNGTTNDGVLRNSATLLRGKSVLKGRQSVLPTDPDFQRRTVYLQEEDEPSVRMVQYIHTREKPHPVGGGLKRPGSFERGDRPKKKRVSRPPMQLKDTGITFHHKLCDLDNLAKHRKQLRYKAIIVGAGAAGLGAARQLIDKHRMDPADILVLEAGERIGGRIHTKLFEAKGGLPAVRVDLGAAYLHGYDFESFFDEHQAAQKNPLQELVEEHKLKIKVDENVEQAYSNGWLKHSAWFVNGDGKPKMAKRNFEYKGGEWNGPDEVFLIDLEIDARLEAIVEKLSQSERDDTAPNSLYAHADIDVKTQFDAVRQEVLDTKKFHPEKRRRIFELLESIAVVKWGYCGPLEQMSLCDAFGVTSTFGFDYEHENKDLAYESEATSTGASAPASDKQLPEDVPKADSESKSSAPAVPAAAQATTESPEPWTRQGKYDAMMLDGYGEVIDILSVGVPVAMGAKVESITLDSRGRRANTVVSVQSPMQKLTLQADAVIVTVSLGVLKSGQISFEPSMDKWAALLSDSSTVQKSNGTTSDAAETTAATQRPMPKSAVIEALGFGFENKVVVRFAEKFWNSKGGNASHWQSRDQRFRFLNLDALGKPGTVVVHVGPPFSVQYKDSSGKQYSDSQVVLEVCKTLQEMFALNKRPVPVDSYVTHWGQDELVRGSYSYQKVYSGSDMCDSLGVPEWGGRLCFAGEACCQTRVQCVDGALVTGRKAADNIAAVLAERK